MARKEGREEPVLTESMIVIRDQEAFELKYNKHER
jgi:hypothetical protein